MRCACSYVILLSLLIFSSCEKDAPLPTPDPDPEWPALFVAGYIPHWGMANFDETALKHLNRVYYFSLAPDVDGQFIVHDRDHQNLSKLNESVKSTNCELYIVLGGWYESENIHAMASTAEKRQAYITALVQLCKTYDLDGVDLDWENYPFPFDINDFIDLVNELSLALAANGLGFTVALDVLHYDLATQIINQVDAINLMLYGMLDDAGNHATFNHMVDGLTPYLNNQIPKDKLIVGVPFYGKRPWDENDTSPRAVTYRYIVEQSFPSPDMNKYQKYAFNGRALLKAKVEYLRKNEFYGIMSWELSQDVEYVSQYSLLRSIVKAND